MGHQLQTLPLDSEKCIAVISCLSSLSTLLNDHGSISTGGSYTTVTTSNFGQMQFRSHPSSQSISFLNKFLT